MRSFKNILIVISLFILTGCANLATFTDQHASSILNNEKALVLFSTKIKYTHKGAINKLIDSDESSAYTKWENVGIPNSFFPNKESEYLSKSYWDYVLYVYVVDPGKYNLAEIAYTKHYALSGKEEHKTINIDNLINFTVAGGEVIYLGEIGFEENDNNVTYKVVDKFDQIYKDSEKIFPKLYNRLKKRLISNQ